MSSFSRSLSVVAVGSRGMVNVIAICAPRDRHAIEGGAYDDRNRAAEGPLAWRAGPVALPVPH
eukprot:6866685-Prymnesium_polylepis.1